MSMLESIYSWWNILWNIPGGHWKHNRYKQTALINEFSVRHRRTWSSTVWITSSLRLRQFWAASLFLPRRRMSRISWICKSDNLCCDTSSLNSSTDESIICSIVSGIYTTNCWILHWPILPHSIKSATSNILNANYIADTVICVHTVTNM